MLKGYKSPTGNTVRVALDLAALMIISAVSENTSRVSLVDNLWLMAYGAT